MLNDQLLQGREAPQHIRVLSRWNLIPNFLSVVRRECDIARQQNQPVLVLLFGHGDCTTKGVALGLAGLLPNITYPLLEMDDFRAAAGKNVRMTVLSTACYSGGWAINPSLNTTTLAAAGPSPSIIAPTYITGESESWAASDSIGRMCGSIYASSVIEALCQENASHVEAQAGAEPAAATDEEKAATYSTFAHTIFQVLFTRMDKWAAIHDIRFSAQDDEWEMEWHQRTGLPLAYYASRWDSLTEVLPAKDSSWSRDPSSTDTSEDLNQVPRGATGSLRGSANSLSGGKASVMRSRVLQEASMYMASFPGRDTVASNSGLHNAINRLSRGEQLTFDELERIHLRVEYRMKAMQTADALIGAIGLPGPEGFKCAQWDVQAWSATQEAQQFNNSQFQHMLGAVGRCGLFPQPLHQQGQAFPKLNIYIAAALMVAKIDSGTLPVVFDELAKRK